MRNLTAGYLIEQNHVFSPSIFTTSVQVAKFVFSNYIRLRDECLNCNGARPDSRWLTILLSLIVLEFLLLLKFPEVPLLHCTRSCPQSHSSTDKALSNIIALVRETLSISKFNIISTIQRIHGIKTRL